MRHRIGLCWLALGAASVLSAQTPPAATPPAPETGFGEVMDVNVVNVEVYVSDRDGKRVTDLKREDFAVSEDGKPVEVTNFAAISSDSTAPALTLAGPAPAAPGAAAQAAPPASSPPPNPENALSLVVFLDDLHLRPEHRTKAVEQIRAFLAHSVRPGDRVMVATYGLGMRLLQPFTEDRSAVDSALRQAEGVVAQGQLGEEARRSAFRTMYQMHQILPCALENVRPIEIYAAETRDEALRTVNALTVIINSLSGVPGHRALLFVSDGISITPGEELFQAMSELCGGSMEATEFAGGGGERASRGGDEGAKYDPRQAALDSQKYSLAQRFEDLAAHASANRVTLYTLQASGMRGFANGADYSPDERRLQSAVVQQMQTSNLQGSLTALAVDTGGRAMLDANDLGPELARMQEDFESYYSFGYTPAHHGDGRQHKVEVKVKRPGLRIRYRPSYRDKPVLEKAVDRTLTALLHGIEDNPLEVAVEVGEQTLDKATGTWAVPVRLKIPLYKLAIINQQEGGSYKGKLRLLVATRDGKGGTSPVRQVEVPLEISRKEVLNAMGQHYLYTLTLKMSAGDQRVAVAVRDELGAVTSYLSRSVSVGAVQAAVPAVSNN